VLADRDDIPPRKMANPFLELEVAEARARIWGDLLCGTRLFDALQALVDAGAFPLTGDFCSTGAGVAPRCLHYFDLTSSGLLPVAPAGQRLVWCAEQAVRTPDIYRTEIDRCVEALRNQLSQLHAGGVTPQVPPTGQWIPPPLAHYSNSDPNHSRMGQEWLWGCIRTFLRATVLTRRSVYVATAQTPGEDGEHSGMGKISRLEIEILGNGSEAIAQHPCDAVPTSVAPDFAGALRTGWHGARSMVYRGNVGLNQSYVGSNSGDTDSTLLVDARWRLLDLNGEPIRKVIGPSAGAAALRGFWYALNGKFPDDELIVLGAVEPPSGANPNYRLVGVDAVVEKVRAIVDLRMGKNGKRIDFDKIVVFSEDNAQAACAALGSHLGEVVVENLNTGQVFP
jgi:hypothetical protein